MDSNKFPYQRLIIFGSAGIGKTTLAKEISQRFGLPYIDIDAVLRESKKTGNLTENFLKNLTILLEADSWVTDGSYTDVQATLWARAQTLIWLDYPFGVKIARLLGRSLNRILTSSPAKKRSQEQHLPGNLQ